RRQCCLGAMALLAAAGCSPAEARSALISEKKERELGQEAASEVERTVGLVRDPALVGYVSEIGRRLVAHTSTPDAPYRFHVADETEPNAFALPGGFVYVTRGLLALANSEDELAGVMRHVIGHVVARHPPPPPPLRPPDRSVPAVLDPLRHPERHRGHREPCARRHRRRRRQARQRA